MRPLHFRLATALVVVAAGCHIDDLVDPPPTGLLVTTPARVEARAAAGSSAPRIAALAVRSTRNDAVAWTAGHSGPGDWLTIVDGSGSTPDSLRLRLDPTGLSAGTYADTLLLVPDDPDGATTRVPVTFVLEGCGAGTIDLNSTRSDSLRASDCASLRHPGRPARRYRFSGAGGDSVTIHLTSPTLAVLVSVDTAQSAASPVFAQSSACASAEGACLRYLRLPMSGDYTIEVTTTGSGSATGFFTLALASPHGPALPDPLAQTATDSVTPITVGAATPEPAMVVRAAVSDPDLRDTLVLEVEIQPVATSFTGDPTARSAPTPSGGTAYAHLNGLSDGTGYHWRARILDQTGRATAWRSFGDNPESAPDLRIAVAADRLEFRQQPTTEAAGAPITPAVEVVAVDQNGAVVTSFTGTITLALGSGPAGATLSGDASVSAVAGVATFPGLSLDRAGSGYTLTASSSGMTGAVSSTFAVTPGDAARLAFTQQPTNTGPGAAITPAVTVTAYDGYGNVVTSFVAPITIAIGRDGSPLQNATLGGTRTRSAAAGVARFADLTIDQVGTGYTLVATAWGPTSDTSDPFAITPIGGSPAEQRFSQAPGSATAGAPLSPPVTVTILDALGAPVTNAAGPVTLALTGGTAGAILSGTTTRTPSGGIASFDDLRVDRAGTGYQLRSVSPGVPEITSPPFDITAVPPITATRLSFTAQPPSLLVVGSGFGVSVAGVDGAGTTAPGFSGNISLTLIGAVPGVGLTGDTQVAAVNGVATFTGLGVSGPCVGCQLLAAASALTSATSTPFTVILPGSAP